DLLELDVLPHVELGPVADREHPQRLARAPPRVVDRPELGTLPLRVPLVLRRPNREDPLLGTRLLLVAAGPAEAEIVAVQVDDLLEPLRLPEVGVQRGAVVERVDAPLDTVGVLVHDEVEPQLGSGAIAE